MSPLTALPPAVAIEEVITSWKHFGRVASDESRTGILMNLPLGQTRASLVQRIGEIGRADDRLKVPRSTPHRERACARSPCPAGNAACPASGSPVFCMDLAQVPWRGGGPSWAG